MNNEEVRIHDFAVGGEGVGRFDDGRVVFVQGVVPGDLVTVDINETRKRHSRGTLATLVEPGPDRQEPSCPEIANGCGGCDWQHVAGSARRRAQVELVKSTLRRQGGVDAAVVTHGGAVSATGYRTTIRLGVSDSRAGFRRLRSSDLVHVASCEVAAPGLQELILLEWLEATEVTLRLGERTGERMAVVHPLVSDDLVVPDDVRVIGTDQLRGGRRAWIHEEAAGRRWRLSALSFFQSGPEAAELLTLSVGSLMSECLASAESVADLYGGVGLFAGSLAGSAPNARWTLVESSKSALADARVNLADVDVRVRDAAVERWRPEPHDVVIADPPRAGLGMRGVEAVVGCDPAAVCLVSCDLGSLGRDVDLLRKAGFVWSASMVLDLFPETSHTEVVSRFERS